MQTRGHAAEDCEQIKLSIIEHLYPYFSSSFLFIIVIIIFIYFFFLKKKDTFGKSTRFVKTISLNIRTYRLLKEIKVKSKH